MDGLLLESQHLLRMSVFLIIFALMATWEVVHPRKALSQPKWYRWCNNLGLVIINSLLLPLSLPFLAIMAASIAQSQSIGLLNQFTLPKLPVVILSIILLDMCIYWQHRIFHQVPLLWRLHRVHHADQDIDVTTGARFHFIEIWLSMILKITIIFGLGIPVIAVLLFEIILNGCAMFNHSNVKIAPQLDKVLRSVIVTPDMHRVHHSVYRNETDSNYGFCLSLWDRVFGSYIAQPKAGHQNMQIGINRFRSLKEQGLLKMLTQPFRER